MSPVGFESTMPTGERPQTYTLDHTASGTRSKYVQKITNIFVQSNIYAHMHIYTYIPTKTPRYIHMRAYINAKYMHYLFIYCFIYIYIYIYTWAGIV